MRMLLNSKILIAGSLAYDHVMNYDGYFKNMLMPDKLDSLSVTFTTTTKTVHFGGCGGNIAYTLKLLKGNPLLVGVAGKDFEEYGQWLKKQQIDDTGIVISPDFYTACAYILTDRSLNQITIFQVGAMASLPFAINLADYHPEEIAWAMVAPDDTVRMMRLAQQCKHAGIPYFFDPAQQIGNLKAEELEQGIGDATVLIVNDYEAELLTKKMGKSRRQLSAMVPNYIETHGENGSSVKTPAGEFFVRAVRSASIVDPTGCGDAFRGGVLAGLQMGFLLEKACKLGTLAATYNLEHKGTQGHAFTLAAFKKRYEDSFGEGF